MKKAPTAQDIVELRQRIVALREQYRKLEAELSELDRKTDEMAPLSELRERAIAPMRGSVIWYGDIISPLDIEWDAEQ